MFLLGLLNPNKTKGELEIGLIFRELVELEIGKHLISLAKPHSAGRQIVDD